MTTEPLVSVLMPTYNGERFVAEAIETVLAQSYERTELLVVDDASSDATAEVVEGYARRYPERIRLSRKADRRGPCRRRNDALDLSRGSILAWLDQDDLWLPEKIERQVAMFAARPDVGLVYTGYEAFDSDSGQTVEWRDESIEAVGDVLAPLFFEGCFIASVTAAFRREVLDRRDLRLREKDFSFGDDYFLWLTIALDWQVVRIDDVLARYRRHPENETEQIAQTNFHLRRIDLLHEFLDEFPEAKERLGPWRRRGLRNHAVSAAGFEYRNRRHRAAASHLLRALGTDPVGTVRVVGSMLVQPRRPR
jgi:glycosyltransferase involved in cell wall biosynthesis